jgi:RNA polymerase sigma-70 factor (ECF subfamily)
LVTSADSATGHRTSDLASAALIERVAGGDESALAALYETTSSLVFGLVLRVLGVRLEAEEVLLDVYTQVWRQASSYDSSRGAPLAWLLMIARSRAIDRLRSGSQTRKRAQPLEAAEKEHSTVANPEEAAATSERRKLVLSALETLAPEQREVIELAYYSGLSHSEIAAQLDQPVGTVKTRTRLGMMKLYQQLHSLHHGRSEKI